MSFDPFHGQSLVLEAQITSTLPIALLQQSFPSEKTENVQSVPDPDNNSIQLSCRYHLRWIHSWFLTKIAHLKPPCSQSITGHFV